MPAKLRQLLCAIWHRLRWGDSHLGGYHCNKDGSVDWYCWNCEASETWKDGRKVKQAVTPATPQK